MNILKLIAPQSKAKAKQQKTKGGSRIKFKMGINKYHIFLGLSSVALIYSIYFYATQNLNIDALKSEYVELKNSKSDLEKQRIDSHKKKEEFKNKLAKIAQESNTVFIPDKSNFGVYKFIIYLDKLKKIVPFEYRLNEKEKNINATFKYYELELTIPYQSRQAFEGLLAIFTKNNFMSFEKGSFKDGKFNLFYRVYSAKGN